MRTCLIIAGVLAGLLLLAMLGGYLVWRAMTGPRHKAQVTQGTALTWRTIQQRKRAFGFMDVVNLDSDPEQEIAVFRPDLECFDLSGGKLNFTPPSSPEDVMFCWDYDRDGVSDFIANEFQFKRAATPGAKQQGLTDHMVAYSVNGKLLGKVAGHEMGPQAVFCDMDGDGKEDLFMSEEGDYGPDPGKGVRAFGRDGGIIFSGGPDFNSPYVIAGDVDGNGKDEIIDVFSGKYIDAGGGTHRLNYGSDRQWCLDIDGDKRDELVGGDGTVTDLSNGHTVQLAPPPGYGATHLEGEFSGNIALMQYNGKTCVVAAVGSSSLNSEGLAIWDTAGNLEYCENFGEKVAVLRVARGPQGDSLVVLTEHRLLVWP